MQAPERASEGFPSSLGSESWVGRDQGHTGGLGGEGAENWCMGDARKGMRQDIGIQ